MVHCDMAETNFPPQMQGYFLIGVQYGKVKHIIVLFNALSSLWMGSEILLKTNGSPGQLVEKDSVTFFVNG